MNRFLGAGLLTVLFMFGLGSASEAATLFTAPLEIDFAGDSDVSLVCIANNVSTKTREITIDVINIDGVSINTVTESVAPGARLGVTQDSENGNATPSHCKFNVKGNKSSVRASACIFRTGPGCISALPAS